MEIENSSRTIYVNPYLVKSIDECDFYHYITLPGKVSCPKFSLEEEKDKTIDLWYWEKVGNLYKTRAEKNKRRN